MKSLLSGLALVLVLTGPVAASPVVLELFTSQACSSCPPADALLQKLAADPQVLALSFHVTYWDGAGWTDPFSLPASTARQKTYARRLPGGVYTPELVIDGMQAMIGSRQSEVAAGLRQAETQAKPVQITLAAGTTGQLAITLVGEASGADIWLIAFSPAAITAVHGGENSGRELTSINNVSAITHLGMMGSVPQSLSAPLGIETGDSYAVLVQAPDGGAILGAAAFKPAA